METLKLEVITPEKIIFSGAIHSIKVPGTKGEFMVLKNHAPILSTLQNGEILIVKDTSESQTITILGGVIEVKQNKVIVLADI